MPLSVPLIILSLLLPCLPASASDLLEDMPERPSMPTLDLADSAGHRHRTADYLGRPLIVNFWATWCPPCRAEMPALQRASEALRADGIGVIAINVGEDASVVEAFRTEQSIDFPLLLDPDTSASQRWPMRGLPTTFIVDESGRLVYKAVGERDWDDPELLEAVRALQNGSPSR